MAILLFLCACGPKEEPEPDSKLLMGYGKAEITPKDSIQLNGYGTSSNRMSTEVLDDLYVTCIAVKEDTTNLLYSQDLLADPSQHTGIVNHDEEDKVELAQQVVDERKAGGKESADKLAKQLGFRSVYHAADIVSCPKRNQKEFEISSMRMGGLGVMMFSVQIFSDTGVKTLEQCPTESAFVLGLANASWYIIPSEAAFAYGAYDVNTSYFAKSAEKIGKLLAEMVLMTMD